MKRLTSVVAGLVALTTLAAASTQTTAASSATTEPIGSSAPDSSTALDLDTNGDGALVIGIATPGPRDDGAFYQALVDGLTAWSAGHGFEEPVVVDNIKPEEAQTSLESLARQNVDMIAVGAAEIGDSLGELSEQYPDIIWYCNCGGEFDEYPNLIQQGDDSSEIAYSAGVATALLMQASGGDHAAMIGNNNFNFERESFGAFRLGLGSIDPAFAENWTYVATGSFNDSAAATEAFNNLTDQGVDAIYPYLGGALETVVKLANENDIIVMSAGAADVCDDSDFEYQIAVRFDAGQFATAIFDGILTGEIQRGEKYTFHVGVDDVVGAVICDPTPEQQAAMDAAYEQIAAGELEAEFEANRAEAYSS